MRNKPVVGVIGLGIMGFAMAKNAAKAGFPVVATNRSLPPRDEAAKAGLTGAATPRELAGRSDVIVVMVSDAAAVRSILNGPDGVLAAKVAGKILIQASTIDEPSTMEFERAALSNDMRFLDCPVTGSKKQVEEAQLIMLAGGDAALIEECKPFLLSVGKAVVHAGPVGKGTALKLCMNLIVAQMTTALCESVALARATDFSPEKIFEVIGHSPALNCGYFNLKRKPLLENDFPPAFSLANMLKDVRFMLSAADARGLPLPVTAAAARLMEEAVALGRGAEDLSTVVNAIKPNHKTPLVSNEMKGGVRLG